VRLLDSFLEGKFPTLLNNKHNIRGQCLVRIGPSRVTTQTTFSVKPLLI